MTLAECIRRLPEKGGSFLHRPCCQSEIEFRHMNFLRCLHATIDQFSY